MADKTQLLNRFASDRDERMILARVLDQLALAQERGVPSHTVFLSPAQQVVVGQLLAAVGHPRHLFYGGMDGAERKICIFLPDWQEPEDVTGENSPLGAIGCTMPASHSATHRDVLGSLMGLGMSREMLGDIILVDNVVQVVALANSVPLLCAQWDSIGRQSVSPGVIGLDALQAPQVRVKEIRDTVATLRLDAVVASGFSMSRGKATTLIGAGKVALNHRSCEKSGQAVTQGDVITSRGLGKCLVKEVSGTSKKGRIMIILERYL